MKIIITGQNLRCTRVNETVDNRRADASRQRVAHQLRDAAGRWTSKNAKGKFKRFFVLAKELED